MIAPVTEAVTAKIGSNGKQPRRESLLQSVTPKVLVGADEGVVGKVLGVGPIAQKPQAQPKNRLLIPRNDLSPCLRLSIQ